MGQDAVAIGTTVNVNVAVSVEVLDRSPADDSIDFDPSVALAEALPTRPSLP